jgi:hypothetical protein
MRSQDKRKIYSRKLFFDDLNNVFDCIKTSTVTYLAYNSLERLILLEGLNG